MKTCKLLMIALLAMSFGLFSCNQEDSLISLQDSNEGLGETTEATFAQDTVENVVEVIVTATRDKIEPDGGNSFLSTQLRITRPDGQTYTVEPSDVIYTGSGEGFRLSGRTVTASPIVSMNVPGRSIDITAKVTFEGISYEGYITIHQEGTDIVIAKIGSKEFEGKPIYLAPGTYLCYTGYYTIGYAKETWVFPSEGGGVSTNPYFGTVTVSANADALVRLTGILPGLPTIQIHIIAQK